MSEHAADRQSAITASDEALRVAAHELFRGSQYAEARAAWQELEARDTNDGEPGKMIAALVIAESREQAGLEVAGESTRRLKPRPRRPTATAVSATHVAVHLPASTSLNPLQQLEAAVRERPSIPDLYLQLAQAYLEKDRDYDAERLLFKGREATDHDPRVQEMWEDVSMLRHARRVVFAEQDVKAADNPQTRQALEQTLKDRDKAELDIFRGRVKRQGADGAAHYGLGVRLQRADRVRDACPHLEKALEDSGVRCEAALALGDCLKQLEDIPGAMRNYRLAANSALWTDQRSCQIEALHHAAKLADEMQMPALRQRYAAELLRAEPGHREAQQLMNK